MRSKRVLTNYRGLTCLNCGHPLDLSDKFCANCGQINTTKKLSFKDFFLEFFGGIFSYDSRMNRTLITLIFRPGKISEYYIKGARTKYVNPFRFFLSIAILFFIVYSFSLQSRDFDMNPPNEKVFSIENLSNKEREELKKEIQSSPVGNTINIDSIFSDSIHKIEDYKDRYISQQELDTSNYFNAAYKQITLYIKFYDQEKITSPVEALKSLNHNNTWKNRYLYRKSVEVSFLSKDPKAFLEYLISKSPFIIFFYLPVFALFIWLFYYYKPFNYLEHLVFTFHVQSTFFVFILFALILDLIFKTEKFTSIAILVFLFYLYKALRNFYKEGVFLSLVKFLALNFIFLTLAFITALISAFTFFAIR